MAPFWNSLRPGATTHSVSRSLLIDGPVVGLGLLLPSRLLNGRLLILQKERAIYRAQRKENLKSKVTIEPGLPPHPHLCQASFDRPPAQRLLINPSLYPTFRVQCQCHSPHNSVTSNTPIGNRRVPPIPAPSRLPVHCHLSTLYQLNLRTRSKWSFKPCCRYHHRRFWSLPGNSIPLAHYPSLPHQCLRCSRL